MALFRRPRSMPRFSRGRMFNRRSGTYAPSLYSGFRPRRASHRRHQTQVSPYGAGGGGRRQMHAGHAGHGGNVYAAMLAQARRGQGTNMGMLHHTPGHIGSRTFRTFRTGGAKAKRNAYRNFIGNKTRKDFGSYAEWRSFRKQGKRVARQAKRDFAENYKNPFGTTHRRGRMSFGQDPYSGRRLPQLVGFRGRSTLGTENRFGRIRERHRGATRRHEFGQRNPLHRGLNLGGYRYMSPNYHRIMNRANAYRRSPNNRVGPIINRAGTGLGNLYTQYKDYTQFLHDWNKQPAGISN